MARTVRSANLETRSARLKLAKNKYHWRDTGVLGLALGYWRGTRTSTWIARVLTADKTRYVTKKLGMADDHDDANGVDTLDYFQAVAKARDEKETVQQRGAKHYTVADAAKAYLEWFAEHKKALRETEHATNAHIVPSLGNTPVEQLTAAQIRQWLNKLAVGKRRLRTSKHAKKQNFGEPPRTDDEKRARRATANRVLAVLKAMLNKAHQDGHVRDTGEWGKKVKPFKGVDEPRIRFLTDAEAASLVTACAPDLRSLVRAALLTGSRFGELAAMKVRDVDTQGARIYISQSKSGRPRYVPLNAEGVKFFRVVTHKREPDDLVFVHEDGRAWGKNHHVRPLHKACSTAEIVPPIAFHELRHTYASHLAQAGVSLQTIAKLLGHSDSRITERHYAHLSDKTLQDAVGKLPQFYEDGMGEPQKTEKVRKLRS